MQALQVPGKRLLASDLLALWEQGAGQSSAAQALQLLTAACPEVPPERLAGLSIGRRDAGLFTLREWTFGPGLEGMATCPECAATLELPLRVADLWASAPTTLIGKADEAGMEWHVLRLAGFEVTFRLPNSLDLEEARNLGAQAFRLGLLERCVRATREGKPQPLGDLPDEVLTAIMAAMEEADPQANVVLALSCPSCGHEWPSVFDIVSFFWSEINAWAYRLLREVHTLASAYGWSESDILRMSPWRREVYLRMVAG